MPPGVDWRQKAYDNLAEEEIYARLPKDDGDKGKDPGGCGGFTAPGSPSQDGEPEDKPGDSPGKAGQPAPPSLKEAWEKIVISAALASQGSRVRECPG